MATFSITESKRERGPRVVRILRIAGDLDAHTFPALQERLEKLADDGERAVVIDCGALDYISSAGVGVLKKMVLEMRAQGGDIRIAALSEKIRNIVNLLGFSKIIQLFETVDEAVASF